MNRLDRYNLAMAKLLLAVLLSAVALLGVGAVGLLGWSAWHEWGPKPAARPQPIIEQYGLRRSTSADRVSHASASGSTGSPASPQ